MKQVTFQPKMLQFAFIFQAMVYCKSHQTVVIYMKYITGAYLLLQV